MAGRRRAKRPKPHPANKAAGARYRKVMKGKWAKPNPAYQIAYEEAMILEAIRELLRGEPRVVPDRERGAMFSKVVYDVRNDYVDVGKLCAHWPMRFNEDMLLARLRAMCIKPRYAQRALLKGGSGRYGKATVFWLNDGKQRILSRHLRSVA